MQRSRFHRLPAADTASSLHRRGAAVVEFAIMAPLFLLLVLGVVEMGYALNASNTMYGVVREGGRLASQDFTKSLEPNQTANDKVISDIRNMLTAAGIDGANATITIEHADSPGTTFDLQDPDNYLDYFKIKVAIDYEDVSAIRGKFMGGQVMNAEITFRLGRVMMSQ
jgi:Flp pilus assembly protein TadG